MTLDTLREPRSREQKWLDADRRHWSKRLAALATELEREPVRIREVYEVRAPGRMIGVRAAKARGTAVMVDLDALLATDPKQRAKWLKEETEQSSPFSIMR